MGSIATADNWRSDACGVWMGDLSIHALIRLVPPKTGTPQQSAKTQELVNQLRNCGLGYYGIDPLSISGATQMLRSGGELHFRRDESGLLYADQRYYHAGFGRFLTADRSNANIDYGNPVSWNRYAYTNGDPVNGMDPTGQDYVECALHDDDGNCQISGGGDGGGDGGNSLLGADQSGGDQSGTDQGGAGSGNSDPSVIDPAVIDPEGQIDLSGQNRGVQNLDPTTTTDVIFQSVWRGIGTTIDLIGVPLLILLNPSSTSMSDVLPSDCPPDTREPTPDNPQGVIFRPLRGSYCQVNAGTGEIWCLDRFHRDHYEVYKNLKQYENGQRDRSVWKNGCRRS